ncbi:MAG: GNAT family N-acetyltransferase [Oscillospiraceae bacterium]|jgi:GNAT superfamily N-acetyltransferase|nr:GNAT family N-acetyltransferase [Oscillospiraceae bacterium]
MASTSAPGIEYRKAGSSDRQAVFALVQNTIKAVYPRYYPQGVVDFFRELHSYDAISADINDGNVYVLLAGSTLAGTGTRAEDHISRLFVSPALQGKGYGNYIMQRLEDEIALEYRRCFLISALPAR